MNKKIYKYEDIKDKILKAVDNITDPIASTLSPKGSNVIYEDDQGNQFSSNDGFTIAKNMQVKDAVENAIMEIIKGGSFKTNSEVGDGTSSTIVMSSVLIKEGLRLVENGLNQMEVRNELVKFAEDMTKELKKHVVEVKNDKDLEFIAKISSNNDKVIAKDVVDIVKFVGLNGQVMIERGYSNETEIIKDNGFTLSNGIFTQELVNKQLTSTMSDVPVLITDKRLYYKAEAERILQTVLDAGYNEVTIIAPDFMGEALPYFVANHANGKVRVALIVEKKTELLEDLAIYLGGEVVKDKKGSLVDSVTIDNFMMAKRVYSNPIKTIVSRDKKDSKKEIEIRVKTLGAEKNKVGNKNSPEYKNLENRIASLTNGMITVKVGGTTPLEVMERIYRYEDAINAARAAMREGYLPGAGIAILEAYKKIENKTKLDFKRIFKKASEINIRQIALNCGENPDSIVEKIVNAGTGMGYNAANGKIEDIVKAGIIEPYLVTTQVLANAVSIANIIITSKYLIVNDLEDIKDNK